MVQSKPILIEDSSWVGFNSIITKGVTLKKGTVLGCGSILTKSTESYGVYGGNPAILIKTTD
jgi:maltose O-acetyltransferase